MVVRHYPMPKKPENTSQCITDNRRADMTNMHGLGGVGCAEINNNCFHFGGRFNPKTFIRGGSENRPPQPSWVKTKIDETRAGNFPGCGNIMDIELSDDFLR